MDPKQVVVDRFSTVEPALRDISKWLYENPEIAYEERGSSARLVEFLRDNGLTVDYPAWGLETAFDARTGSEGPEVVICAEYDALPEVGHACGHNVIATAACGAGVALAGLTDELGFRVRILGTPAEESYGGKIDMIEAGAFEGAAAAMMIHPSPEDVVDPAFLAVAHLDIDFYGKESHAAFAPQVGINALDAAVQAYVNVSTLRQTLYNTDKMHGVITHGGGAPNVIPQHTSLAFYVRAASMTRLAELRTKVEACFEAAALATGCSVEIKPRGHTYTEMHNDPVMVELFSANSDELGRTMGSASTHDPGAAGSTDMANVSRIVPTIHPMLSINSAPAVNHQREFAAHTVTPDGERAIRDGAIAMAWTVVDIATEDRWDELGAALPR
jgi:amidohydrolase